MKKWMIWLLITAFCILPAYGQAADTAETVETEQAEQTPPVQEELPYAVRRMMALEIMEGYEDGLFHPDDALTRAQMAQILCTVLNVEPVNGAWYDAFYSDEQVELGETEAPAADAGSFLDVPSDHWASGVIETVCQYGIMVGDGAGNFEPDREMLYEEAVKIMIIILGYRLPSQMAGGYPQGYIATARDLGLLRELSGTAGKSITRLDLAHMLSAALDTEILQCVSYGETRSYETHKDETLLTEIMQMTEITGIVEENDITSMWGPSTLRRGEVKIDNVLLQTGDAADIGKYLAYQVEAYYKHDKKTDKNILHSYLLGSNNIRTVTGQEIIGYADGQIVYERNGKNSSLRIPEDATVIYNGLAAGEWNGETLTPKSGSVTVVSNKGKTVVLVKDYQTIYVASVDTEESIVYDKLGRTEGLVLDTADEDMRITILNAEGGEGSFAEIAKGQVLMVAENEHVKEVVLSSRQVSGKIEEERSEEDGPVYLVNQVWYQLAEEYLNSSQRMEFSPGDQVTLYLNAEGKIGWMESSFGGGTNYGYIMQMAKDDGFSATCMFRIYALNGTDEVYKCASRVRFEDKNGNEVTCSGSEVYDKMQGVSGLIEYQINEDNEIKRLILPADKPIPGTRKLYKIGEVTSQTKDNMAFQGWLKTFGGAIYVDSSTKVLCVPADITEADKYIKTNYNMFQVDGRYEVIGYGTDPASPMADIVISGVDASTGALSSWKERKTMTIALDLMTSLDKDYNEVQKILAYQDGKTVELTLAEEYEYATSPFGTGEYQLEKGDIFRYATDTDGNVSKIYIVYKPGIPNPSGGSDGFVPEMKYRYYISQEAVDRANDTTNLFVGGLTTGLDGNPFQGGFGSDLQSYAHRFSTWSEKSGKTFLGYVYQVSGGIATITTQDITVEKYSPSGIPETEDLQGSLTGIYINTRVPLNIFPIDVVEYGGKELRVTSGSADDIRPYTEFGANCSKVLVAMTGGEPRHMIVLRNMEQ